MQFIIGFKVVAGISLLLGGVLIAICGLSFHQFRVAKVTHENTTKTKSTTPNSISENDYIDPIFIRTKQLEDEPVVSAKPLLLVGNTDKKVDVITDSIQELKKQWNEFKPFLLGSTGVALACGIIQVLVSLFIICSGSKDIRHRSRYWKCMHFFLCGLLIASLLVPTIFNLQNDSLKNLRELMKKIGSSIKSKVEFDKFQVSWVEIFSGIVALDIAGIVILIVSTCCLMRNAEYDYRAT